MKAQLKKRAAPEKADAVSRAGAQRTNVNLQDYTILEWFSQQGARFVRVAPWNAKVNSPGKQPIDKGWQNKPLILKDILSHVKQGGNVGLLCGDHSGGLCLLDVDDCLEDFLEYFPGLQDAPIIQRRDAFNRGKILLRMEGDLPKNKKWQSHHLEFLSTGNQGVIPPSIHPGGAAYELVNADKPAMKYDGTRLLQVCQAWADRDTQESYPAGLDPLPSAVGWLSRLTRDFIQYGAGTHTRNNRLFTAACDMAGCKYTFAEAESALLPVWARMSKDEKEARATIKSAYSQARTPANPHAFDHVGKRLRPVEIKTNDEEKTEVEESDAFPLFSNMPELPKGARLTQGDEQDAKQAGKFIDDYVKFGMKDAPMSPPLFHLTYALAILSTAIARRVHVSTGTNAIYPNLYIMLSAPSTLYTKTTGHKSALKVLDAAGLSYLRLPDSVTPQSLISELSNRPQDNFRDWAQDDKDEWQKERLFAGQRAWWIDEAASLLSQFQQKHLAELLPIVLKLYDCDSKIKASTQIRGRETVRNAYLTICGPTTPAALRPHLKTNDYWTNGLFARFLLVAPDTAPVRIFYPSSLSVPAELAKHINQLAFDRLETPQENALGPTSAPPSTEAKVPRDVWKKWDKYHESMFELIQKKAVPEKLSACYGRLHEKAIKIAMLLAASDWVTMAKGNPLVIRPFHWARAQEITEGYRASLHRIVETASMPVENEDDELTEKIIGRVRSGRRNSRRELTQDLHVRSGIQRQRFDMIVDQLIKDGVMDEQEVRKERGPGTVRLFYKNP